MSLRTKVQQYPGRFSAADELLVKELIAHPVEASYLTASELARRVNVHEATAVRLAKKLGYRGYPELRAALQAEVLPELQRDHSAEGDPSPPAERVRRRLAALEGQSILGGLVLDELAALQELASRVSQAQIEAAARLLADARRVFLFGRGHATTLVELMERRLRRAGVATVDLRAQGRDLAEHLIDLRRDDLVFAFAFRVQPPELRPLLLRAADAGTPTLLLADSVGPLVRPRPQLLIHARRGATGDYQTLTVPMVICDALLLTLSRLDGGRTLEALDRLDALTRLFAEENP